MLRAELFDGVCRSRRRVQTDGPTPVPGEKRVFFESIKVHGASLEGNLEGDAVDRDVIVFLPPSYKKGEGSAGRGRAAGSSDQVTMLGGGKLHAGKESEAPALSPTASRIT